MSPKSKRAFLSLQPLMLTMSFVVIHILYGIFLISSYKLLYRDLILYVFKNNNVAVKTQTILLTTNGCI